MTTEYNKYDRDTFEHEGIVWGAKIDASNKGKPLPWLKDDEEVYCHWGKGVCGGGPYDADCVHGWDEEFQIRLPADHFAYTAIAEGFEPWGGGEKAPDDWDGERTLARNGEIARWASWTHPWRQGRDCAHDIIGYKRKVDAAQYTVPASDIAPTPTPMPVPTPEHAAKTLRDEFAMAALVRIAAHYYPSEAAVRAYEYADKMMEARK